MLLAALFVPLRVSVLVGWSERPRFELHVWGIALRRRRLPSWVGRLGMRGVDKLFERLGRKPKGVDSSGKPANKGVPLNWRRILGRFGWWGARTLLGFLSRITRRLDIQLGGIDPSVLGILTGTVAGAGAALGFERLRWLPRFEPGPFRFLFRWTISISLFGGILWLGRAMASFPRRSKEASAQ